MLLATWGVVMKLPDFESGNSVVMRLRAHHICCLPFRIGLFEERSPSFQQIETRIRGMFSSLADAEVMVIEGVDELCRECPFYTDGGCVSPNGDEEAVRKWDAILLKELGVTFNTCLTSRQWHDLIEHKVPLKICQKCQWKKTCRVGSRLLSS